MREPTTDAKDPVAAPRGTAGPSDGSADRPPAGEAPVSSDVIGEEPAAAPPPPAGSSRLDIGALGRQAAAALLARTILMRGVTALGTVALARILDPSSFGVYAVLILVQTVLMYFADFGMGPSLVQQQSEPSREEMATVWSIQQTVSIAFLASIWICAPWLADRFPSLGADFAWQLRILSFSVAFTLIRALPSAMLVRNLRFRELATSEVLAHFVFYATAIAFAIAGAGAWSFVLALTLQNATAALMVNLAWRRWTGISFRPQLAYRMIRFGMAFQMSNIAIALRDGVVPLFGSLGGGVAAIGQLQFSLRISQLTSSVDEIVARVTFPVFSRVREDAPRTARILTDAVVLVCIAIGAPQVWIISTAPLFVPVVFGGQWVPAVPALQLMCVGVLATVPSRVAGSVVFGHGRPRVGLAVTLASLIVLFALFAPLILVLGLAGGGLAYAIAGACGLYLQSWAVRPVARFPWASLGRVYFLCGVAGGCSWIITTGAPNAAGLIISGLVFVLVDLLLLGVFARHELARAIDLVGLDRLGGVPPLRCVGQLIDEDLDAGV